RLRRTDPAMRKGVADITFSATPGATVPTVIAALEELGAPKGPTLLVESSNQVCCGSQFLGRFIPSLGARHHQRAVRQHPRAGIAARQGGLQAAESRFCDGAHCIGWCAGDMALHR